MWVSKVSEWIGSSPESFEAATRDVVERAHRASRGTTDVELLEKRIKVEDDAIIELHW